MGTLKLTKHIGSAARRIAACEVVFLLLLFHCNLLHCVAFDGVDEASKPVMREARERIEKIRKGNFTIKFVDETGIPINDHADISLVHHEFQFGANLCPVTRLPKNHPARKVALQVIDELFSLVRVGHFWSIEEPKRGGPLNWKPTDADVEWALSHVKDMRYHCVIYNMYYAVPKWYKKIETTEDWWPLIEKRIKDVAKKYGQTIHEYDLINEMIMNLKWANKHNPIFPTLGNPGNAARMFRIGERYLPDAKLVMLETHLCTLKNRHYQNFYRYYKKVLDLGAPVDVLGFQGHFYGGAQMPISEGHPQAGPGAFTMKVISDGLDHLATLGKPIHITEYNPPSRMKRRKGPQPRLDAEEIAAWTVNYHSLVFSKPYIHQLTRWFVVDEHGGNAQDGGLVTVDGRKKPNYYALRKLLKQTWTTTWKGSLREGEASFRGFFGKYQVKVPGYKSVKFTLYSKEKRKRVVRLMRL
jgi:endo-1,4-beta-xylanase